MSETCNGKTTCSLRASCVPKCFESRAPCAERRQAASMTEKQDWGLHLETCHQIRLLRLHLVGCACPQPLGAGCLRSQCQYGR